MCEDYDLYYKYMKSQDKLITYEQMAYRYEIQRKAHVDAIFIMQEQFRNLELTQDEYIRLYDWRAELARRADRRMRHFMELEANERYDKNQSS